MKLFEICEIWMGNVFETKNNYSIELSSSNKIYVFEVVKRAF